MKYIKEQSEFILENKILDFFKKFNFSKIKEEFKEKLDITEEDSKKGIFIKLSKYTHDKTFEFVSNNLSTIVGGSLGILLGDLIAYILTIFTDITSMEKLLMALSGMIFMLYRSYKGIDKYGLKVRSLLGNDDIKSKDYDEVADSEGGEYHFVADFSADKKP